jgi:N-acetyl-anhydromuramyl-L-alanine amidase AmpD
MDWTNINSINLEKIETVNFPENQYIQEIYEKKQIILHHTIGSSVEGVISTWKKDADRVATCIIIDKAGIPFQLFSSKYWAYHLKCGNSNLDKHSIAIELVNWGWLVPTNNGKFKTYYGNKVYATTEYYPNGFRGYNYYEKYSDQQIRTVGELILYWHVKYNIPLDYNSDMWDVSSRALTGTPGIWGHTSYRPASQKTDPHPQPELIKMLQTLKGLII